MKKRMGMIVLLCLLVLAGCGGPAYHTMDMVTAMGELPHAENVTLVDTRSAEMYLSGFIPGAKWLPVSEMRNYMELQLPTNKEQPLWVYGETVSDAERVAKELCRSGYENVTVIGSIHDWQGDLTVVTPERVRSSKRMAVFMSGSYKGLMDVLQGRVVDPRGKYGELLKEKVLTERETNAMKYFMTAYLQSGNQPKVSTQGLEDAWHCSKSCEGTLQEMIQPYCEQVYDVFIPQLWEAIRQDDWSMCNHIGFQLPLNYKGCDMFVEYGRNAMMVEAATIEDDADYRYTAEEAARYWKKMGDIASSADAPDWLKACWTEDNKRFQKYYSAKLEREKALKKQQDNAKQQANQSSSSGKGNSGSSSSSGSSGNKGGSSSGNTAHGFVGSEDEWEDYDDYMDDYEYWEHRDVDDMDDWEDDWD